MSRYEQFTIVVVFGVGVIIGDLPVCRRRLSLYKILSAPLFMVADFSTISAFDGVVLTAWSGMKTPLLPKVPCVLPFLCGK